MEGEWREVDHQACCGSKNGHCIFFLIIKVNFLNLLKFVIISSYILVT